MEHDDFFVILANGIIERMEELVDVRDNTISSEVRDDARLTIEAAKVSLENIISEMSDALGGQKEDGLEFTRKNVASNILRLEDMLSKAPKAA